MSTCYPSWSKIVRHAARRPARVEDISQLAVHQSCTKKQNSLKRETWKTPTQLFLSSSTPPSPTPSPSPSPSSSSSYHHHPNCHDGLAKSHVQSKNNHHKRIKHVCNMSYYGLRHESFDILSSCCQDMDCCNSDSVKTWTVECWRTFPLKKGHKEWGVRERDISHPFSCHWRWNLDFKEELVKYSSGLRSSYPLVPIPNPKAFFQHFKTNGLWHKWVVTVVTKLASYNTVYSMIAAQ